MASSTTLSLRIRKDIRQRLDREAEETQLSRAHIVQQALAEHFDRMARRQGPAEHQGRYAKLLAMKGAGIGVDGPRTKQEIDDYIRWLRDDDRIPD